MTDLEALMWTVEQDPHLSATFGSVTILDTRPDRDRLRRRMLHTAQAVPRLRQRVVPGLGRLAPPEWHDDPDFDIDFHLRHLALPGPGTRRELFDLATLVVLDPFERTRPLWEFIVVEGLEDGRAALIQKMHHTVTDGEGGIRMSEQYLDLVRDVPDIDEVVIVPEPESPPGSVVAAARATAGHAWRRTLGVSNRAVLNALIAVGNPSQLPQVGTDLVETTRSAWRQLTATEGSGSPLWADRTLHRRLEAIDLPFDDVHRCAKAKGASINDFFVTGLVRGAASYHRRLGTPLESLRVAMPVSTRRDGSASGNSFVPTRVVLPAPSAEADRDPDEQLRIVHDLLDRTKHERAISLIDPVAGFANLLPTGVLTRLARDQATSVDVTASNLRAAPFDLFVAGSRIEATYPLGPLASTAVNATVLSYCGTLNVGLHIDAGAVPEPALLAQEITTAYAELLA